MFSFFRRLHFEYTAKVSVQNGRYYENAVKHPLQIQEAAVIKRETF